MSDDVFSSILDGVLAQSIIGAKGEVRIQYLRSIVYSNNHIGYKSMLRLVKLIPNLCELGLNNITFHGKRVDGEDITSTDIL